MHDARHRQLLALAGAVLLGTCLLRASGQVPAAQPAQDELRAAKLLETELLARQAGAGEWQKLDRIYADLDAKYPHDVSVRNGHAEFLWSIGERQRAVDVWLAAEKIDPANAIVLDHLGGSYLDAGDAKKADGFYARAVASAPDDAAGHFSLANVRFLFRHELLDAAHPSDEAVMLDALAHFAEAARLQPLDPEYARAYAETFYSVPTPDWRTALAAWQHFYDISPQKDFALLNLARVHMKLGNKPEARTSLSRIQSREFDQLKARLGERIETE
jgi:tetratricopeptide (TPR) repeat protein